MNEHNKAHLPLMGMFAAIILILAFTPLGFIQLPFIRATIIHIPVIIGCLLLGPKHGAALGFLFGLVSLINNTMAPVILSFAFSPLIPVLGQDRGSFAALIVCFVPRILVGVVPWFFYHGLKKLLGDRSEAASLAVAGVVGSLTNTLLVMHFIFLFFRESYAMAQDIATEAVYRFILGIIAMHGIPEAIVAGVLVTAICLALKAVRRKG